MNRLFKSIKIIVLLIIILLITVGCGTVSDTPPHGTPVDKETLFTEDSGMASEQSADHALDPENTPTELLFGEMRIHYIDVGQGDATFIELPTQKTMLIDAGETGDDVARYIQSLDYDTIDILVATHPHADHIGGMELVIDSFQIGDIYMPDVIHTTRTFEGMLDAIDRNGYSITTAKRNDVIYSGAELEIVILSPANMSYDNLNDYSVVISVLYNEASFLFMGDATKLVESEISPLPANVLRVGHHGSNTSSSPSFLKQVYDFSSNETETRNSVTKAAIISCGLDNSYGHPHQEVIERLCASGAEIYITSKLGSIIAITDGHTISFYKNENAETHIIPDKIEDDTLGNDEPQPAMPGAETGASVDTESGKYVGSVNSDKFHNPGCQHAKKIKLENEIWFDSKNEAQAQGYVACKTCTP